ncbi:MAG: Gfo/Idh/MocA family oxidoreductase [Planctomycetes bacterium]|nr:Gfo/Idh/MocA family oxidoreductase [Planctomycetota bacterium]
MARRNVGVAGVGNWGKNLVRDFYELGALHTTCDVNNELSHKLRSQLPETGFVDSFDHLLTNSSIEAVVIATPAHCHYQMVKEALLAGKHVFVEKPLSLKLHEGKELVRIAREQSLVLMVGHILHYHPAIEKLKELIDAGELGKIQYIYSNRLNIGKIRTEENILWSFAPHDISVILLLLNEIPETVYANGGSYLQKAIPDVTLTTMDFKSGVKSHIFVNWLHPFKEQKLVVVGDNKMAVFDDMSNEKLFIYPHRIEWVDRIPVACKSDFEVVPIGNEQPLKAECKHFLDCIETNQAPRTDGHEGLRVLQILQAFQESLSNDGLKQRITPLETFNEPGDHLPFVHESSYIDQGCEIGAHTQIWHFSHVMKGARIGDNCKIGQNVTVGQDVTVGNGCKIQNNVSLCQGVTLEDNIFCGPSIVFTNVFNPRSEISRIGELRPTLVRKGATIGANSTIVCGNTIGAYAFIGAGAVITKDVPDYALVMGNPGRIVGWMCMCGEKVSFDEQGTGVCNSCNLAYIKRDDVTVKRKV